MGDKDKARDKDLEWENRVLCSDESCIGTIGADGCCKECGRPYEGSLPPAFGAAQADREEDSAIEDDAWEPSQENAETRQEGEDADVTDDEWERRTLCRDESCIGVIDEETGCCKECGKPYRDGCDPGLKTGVSFKSKDVSFG